MVSPEQHRRVSDILERVRNLAPEQREAFLVEHCSDDAIVRQEVESLLNYETSTRDGIVEAAEEGRGFDMLAAEVASDAPDEPLPDCIGGYRVVGLLGAGGMGRVYEAEQDTPRRRVAIKIIQLTRSSSQMLGRFKREAEILGHLRHPGIAHIYEASIDTSMQEQPFIVMELIAGLPIDRYVATNGIGTRGCLELIARICDAVSYAHRQGVLHRDLKPHNILVEGTGQPKILDFGVARVTDADVQTMTLQTDVGQLVGTIPYMSPEQVFGDPAQIDERSDVYALGVVLYELLTGSLPYDVSKRPVMEAARIIREEMPTRISATHRSLRGDVETILGKALEKDPKRRYQSAADLATDIRRFLDDEPIAARPPSTLYQLRKFSRRNKGFVIGLTAAVCALLVGTGLAVDFALREQAARGAAEEVTAFLADMLSKANPRLQSKDVTVRQVLDEAAGDIEAQFKDRPLVEARLRLTIGQTYSALGEYATAEPHVRRAVNLLIQEHGEEDLATLDAEIELARVEYFLGNMTEAARRLEALLEHWRHEMGRGDARLAVLIGDYAYYLMAQGKYDEAEPLFEEAWALHVERDGLVGHEAIMLRSNIATLYSRTDRFDEAEAAYLEVIDRSKRSKGVEHPDTVLFMANLALVFLNTEKYDEAIPLFEETYDVQSRVIGPDHPMAIMTLINWSLALSRMGQTAKAETLIRGALGRVRQGDDKKSTISLELALGRLCWHSGQLAEAETLLAAAAQGYSELVGFASYDTFNTYVDIIVFYYEQKKFAESAEYAAKLDSGLIEALGVDHPWRRGSRGVLGRAYTRLGRYQEAEDLLVAVQDATPGRVPTAALIDAFIELYEAWGRNECRTVWRQAKTEDRSW